MAALVTGVVLLVIADDADKYERAGAQSGVRLQPWFAMAGGGVQLSYGY